VHFGLVFCTQLLTHLGVRIFVIQERPYKLLEQDY
jgi:hypothetical protein